MSPRKPKHLKEHTPEQYERASDYFEHHLRMYVDTYVWLTHIFYGIRGRDLISNAIATTHMVHMRAIYQFLLRKNPGWGNAVLAVHYFDKPDEYEPLDDKFLKDWSDNVGSWIVHITTDPMPTIISEMKFPVPELFRRLLPLVYEFLKNVPVERFPEKHRQPCFNHLTRIGFKPSEAG